MADLQTFEVRWEEVTRTTRTATVVAASKTAAARQIRDGDLLTNVFDRRTGKAYVQRQNVTAKAIAAHERK